MEAMSRWTLFEESLRYIAPYHSLLGKLGIPQRYIWQGRDDVRQITNLVVSYDKENKLESVVGKDLEGGEVKIVFSHKKEFGQASFFYLEKEEASIREEFVEINRELKAQFKYFPNHVLDIELIVSIPTEIVRYGETELEATIKFHGQVFKGVVVPTQVEWPTVLIEFDKYLRAHPELDRARIAGLHEKMIGPFVPDIWEASQPTIKSFGDWRETACNIGTILADTFGQLASAAYYAVNRALIG